MENSTAVGGYVIFDCDIGNDDAWALLMLIKGEELFKKLSQKEPTAGVAKSRAFAILGVTCVRGNTDVDNGVRNALRVLDSVDRLDIPVYRGCDHSIIPPDFQHNFFHGRDGFGDIPDLPEVTNTKVQNEHAVNMMYHSVCKYPNKVDFILLGPLTNFAVCINMYGQEFLDKLGNIYIMGGNYRGKGNVTKSAEFNFMLDPEAAHIVFESIKKPMVVVPWETCIDGEMNIDLDWRFEVLGQVDSKAVRLMNAVENAFLRPLGYAKWIVCDAMAVVSFLFPNMTIVKSRLYHATIELAGRHTRGQMVLDHKRKDQGNTRVIMDLHKDNYRKILSWTGGLITDEEIEKMFLNSC
ncbi:pyrimidine-specific ribonucleoside hydrolase RihA [Stomoxys calcitrans]|uniref:pyrimidine-specific ribonucleoside hydrolase RihA n=1 Tax=Stomoxys calcitrans TaxID=35570 RepID=UPI0027E292CF|nr:pyrimidine-specific ribonucleoside hydrolase RihA [Stomoxys calcitrans]